MQWHIDVEIQFTQRITAERKIAIDAAAAIRRTNEEIIGNNYKIEILESDGSRHHHCRCARRLRQSHVTWCTMDIHV